MSSKLLNYPAATTNPHLASGTGPSSGGSSAPGNPTVAGQLNLENLQLDDILCTVCQSVLVEPVFLPCQHRFCRNCLSGTIEKNNLNCPCCRKRFGTWYRNASRVNKLVHEQLWSAIQRQFREYLEEDGGAPGRCNGNGGTGGGNGIVTSCFVPRKFAHGFLLNCNLGLFNIDRMIEKVVLICAKWKMVTKKNLWALFIFRSVNLASVCGYLIANFVFAIYFFLIYLFK